MLLPPAVIACCCRDPLPASALTCCYCCRDCCYCCRDPLPASALTWTIDIDISARVSAALLPPPTHPASTAQQQPGPAPPRFAYVFMEAERSGSFVVERATALGVAREKDRSLLKLGQAVVSASGLRIDPAQCVTPQKPGRRLVILPDCGPITPSGAEGLRGLAQGADMLVTGALQPRACSGSNGGSGSGVKAAGGRGDRGLLSAWDAGVLARELGASCVLLGRFDPMLHGEVDAGQDPLVGQLEEEVAAQFGGDVASACDDYVMVMEKHEGPDPHPLAPTRAGQGQ